jgi:gas vesicle protein
MPDIRSALEAAIGDAESFTTAPVQEAPIETPEKEGVSEPKTIDRDEAGRFSSKATEPVEKQPETLAPPPVRANPFTSWKPAAQEAFRKADAGESLTPEEIKILREEAERREGDWHKGVAEFKTHAERARTYDQVIAPYQNHLKSLGVDAPTAINALLNAEMKLRTGDPASKAQYFAQLAKEYGIDLGAVQAQPQADPQTQYLMDQLQGLQRQQQMWQNQIQAQEQQRVNEEIDSFKTQAPHLDAVREDMADLLETGKAKTLQEAYEMAIWMRPDTRQTLVEQQRIEAQQKALAESQAQRAKTAAVSVKGSSPASAGTQPVKGSLRDIIAAQFAD